MAESEEELKSLLRKVKEEREKAGLKLSIQKWKIMASSPITSRQIDGETMKPVTDFIFLGSKINEDGDCSHEIKRRLLFGRKAMTNLDNTLKSRDLTLPYSQSYNFSNSHVWMWELDHKEGWEPKNCCFWTVVLEKLFKSPLDCKEIKPVNPKGNQAWISIGRADAKADVPILWAPDGKKRPIGKDPDTGKDWRQEKGTTENKMASPTQWTWVWASSGRWWRTRKPGMLQSKGLQRVGHDWVTEQQQNLPEHAYPASPSPSSAPDWFWHLPMWPWVVWPALFSWEL